VLILSVSNRSATQGLTTSITVMALRAFQRPEQTPRIRLVLEQLLEVIHEAERVMAVYDLP
jgi:hypothetical protein